MSNATDFEYQIFTGNKKSKMFFRGEFFTLKSAKETVEKSKKDFYKIVRVEYHGTRRKGSKVIDSNI